MNYFILLFSFFYSISCHSFTDKPIRIVFGQDGASGVQTTFRYLQTSIPKPLDIIRETREGVGGGISQEYVSKKTPDGRTLLYVTSSIILIPLYNNTFTFDPIKSFDTIFYIGYYDQVLVVNSTLSSNLKDLIEYTEKYPQKLMYGHNGEGSTTYRGPLEIFKGNVLGIPYKSTAQMMPDLFGERIHMTLVSTPLAKTLFQNGKVKLVASTGKNRIKEFNIPTVSETIPNYEQIIWHGILAPKGVPVHIKRFWYNYFKSGITESFVKDMEERGMIIIQKDFDQVILQDMKKRK